MARAAAMIDDGRGDQPAYFLDVNQGVVSTIYTTARIYFSWFNPHGNAVFPTNAPALKPGTPLLWVVGTEDPIFQRGPAYAFDTAPANPDNEYLVVSADHRDTPDVAASAIVEWLQRFVGP